MSINSQREVKFKWSGYEKWELWQEIISRAPEFTYEYPWGKGGGAGFSKALGMLSWTSDREGRKQAAVFLAWSALRTRREKNVENKLPYAKWCWCPLKSPSICVYVDCHPQTKCKLNNHLRTTYGNKSDYIPTSPLSHIVLLMSGIFFTLFYFVLLGIEP